MAESLQSLSFDPFGVAPEGRSELSLSGYTDGIEVAWKGLSFGDQEIKAFMAEGEFGSRPIDHIWPLRTIHIPLLIAPTETATFDEVRSRLEAKVAEIAGSGAVLRRVLPSGKVIYVDIVEAKLSLSASWLAENRDRDLGATLELQASPDLYGEEIEGEVHEGTGDLSFTEIIKGTLPARVTNMQVEDKSGNNQLGLMWHFRRRHYSSATSAEWAYDAEALGLLDIAEKVANPGGVSYGAKVVKHPNLSTEWTPVLSTGFLTHTGLYTVRARVYASSTTLPWLRLVYGAGDVVAPQENVQAQVPQKEGWYLVNLGQVNIPALPFGTQRWEGVIQARTEGTGASEAIYIDRVWFQCGDESSGVLAALESTTTLSSLDAYDPLVTRNAEEKPEALNGTEGNRGGKWEDAAAGTGFTRTIGGTTRNTTSDSEGRVALLSGSKIGAVRVKCAITQSTRISSGGTQTPGVYLRWYSSAYWIRVVLSQPKITAASELLLQYQAGGAVESVLLKEFGGSVLSILIDAELDTTGGVTVRNGDATYRGTTPATFKAGETHAEGTVGIHDYNSSTLEVIRTFSEFSAAPPPPGDAVVYANKAAYLSTQGMYRGSEDGLGAGPIGHPGADLPRLPVSGTEEVPVEIAVKPSRGQFGELADSGKDAFSVRVSYRPCYAAIPTS